MSSDEILNQLQQIVDTLKRTIEASAQLSERVEVLERQTGEKPGVLTALQGSLQVLLDTYQKHAEAQARTNEILDARITALENSRKSQVN